MSSILSSAALQVFYKEAQRAAQSSAALQVFYKETQKAILSSAALQIFYRLGREWEPIPGAAFIWINEPDPQGLIDAYYRHQFHLDAEGRIGGGRLSWNADYAASAWLADEEGVGRHLGNYQAGEDIAPVESVDIPKDWLRNGKNVLCFRVRNEIDESAMLQFKINVW